MRLWRFSGTTMDKSSFLEFKYQAEKALDLFHNLSTEDKVQASILWNSLYNKIQTVIQAGESLSCPSEDIPKKLDEIEIAKPSSFHDSSFCTTSEEELRLDDDRVIDKVLDEVIHLEAEAEDKRTQSQFLPAISKDDIIESLSVNSEELTSTHEIIPVVPTVVEPNKQIKLFQCSTCKLGLESWELLKDHLKTHEKRFKCTECPSTFSQRGNLNVHLRSHTGERKFLCSRCPKRFLTSGNLRRHLLSHLKLKPYRCSICHSCFTEKKSLITHQRTHTGERPFVCPHCSRRFTQNSVLRSHLSTHSNDKNFSCSKCSKSFRQRAHLQRHIAYIHSGVKNCICPECNFAFVTKTDLNRHLRSHRGEKTFVCDKCGKKFMRQENLTEHINNLHPDSE